MSAAFSDGLPRLNAIASQMLGWRPDEFWQATPSELASALAPPGALTSAPISLTDITQMLERESNG